MFRPIDSDEERNISTKYLQNSKTTDHELQ